MPLNYYGQYITCDTEAEILALAGRPGDVGFALDTKMRYMYNGTSWFPTDAQRIIRGTGTVNLLAAASTKILTTPPTVFRFVVLGVHIEVLSLTGTVVTNATLAVGATPTNYNDIASSQGLTGVLTSIGLTSATALTLASARAALPGSADVYVKVNINAIGPSAYTARFDLAGYFEV